MTFELYEIKKQAYAGNLVIANQDMYRHHMSFRPFYVHQLIQNGKEGWKI